MCVTPIWIPKRERGLGVSPGEKGKPLTDHEGKSLGYWVACGKCPECLKHKQNEWYVRFAFEEKYQRKNFNRVPWFITLTYDKAHLPKDRESTLLDWQAFLKSIDRNVFRKDFSLDSFTNREICPRPRFYATTEFGGLHGRLHWHLLLFNVHHKHDQLDLTNILRKLWHRGFVEIRKALSTDFRYVTKYITKDIQTDEDKPFEPIQVFSKRPALGYQYAKRYISNYLDNPLIHSVHLGGYEYSVPRYFRNKLVSQETNLFQKVDMDEQILPEDSYRESVLRQYYKKTREVKHKKEINYRKLALKQYLYEARQKKAT